jgi:hypothetical protein
VIIPSTSVLAYDNLEDAQAILGEIELLPESINARYYINEQHPDEGYGMRPNVITMSRRFADRLGSIDGIVCVGEPQEVRTIVPHARRYTRAWHAFRRASQTEPVSIRTTGYPQLPYYLRHRA